MGKLRKCSLRKWSQNYLSAAKKVDHTCRKAKLSLDLAINAGSVFLDRSISRVDQWGCSLAPHVVAQQFAQ
jgi:hypothetical protein